jgi:hypothetical protein
MFYCTVLNLSSSFYDFCIQHWQVRKELKNSVSSLFCYVYFYSDIVYELSNNICLTFNYSTFTTHNRVLVQIQHIWHGTIYNSTFSIIQVINRNNYSLSVSLCTTWIRLQYLINMKWDMMMKWNEMKWDIKSQNALYYFYKATYDKLIHHNYKHINNVNLFILFCHHNR